MAGHITRGLLPETGTDCANTFSKDLVGVFTGFGPRTGGSIQRVKFQKILAPLQSILDDEPLEVEPLAAAEVPSQDKPDEPSPNEAARSTADESSAGPPSSTIPVYKSVSLHTGRPDAFYEYRTAPQVTEKMVQVIEGEGPISEAALFKKVARAWGLERTGSRIVERLTALAPRSARKTVEEFSTFYWPKSIEYWKLDFCRVADETSDSKRRIDEVSLEEIAALVLQVLHQVGGAPSQDVARSVCRLKGMARATADAEARAMQAIDSLLGKSRIVAIAQVMGQNPASPPKATARAVLMSCARFWHR